ncbi:GNAT family N-acetyltransferase [Muriicola soli]|nr:GNAT family N-acetyltransferase [Muriicola soli]
MTTFYKEVHKPDLLKYITYSEGKVLCNLAEKSKSKRSLNYSLSLVPFYAEFETGDYLCRKISQFNWNYGISTKGLTSADEYLKTQFNANGRKVILRNIRRLETCFNIRYELHYGSITDHSYTLLMNRLKSMINSRFQEKKERSKDIKEWDRIFESSKTKIRNKSASLFVIYNGEDPIEISLNYHFGRILFSSVSSFDTDYSKFGLGNIEIYKQLEWCIDNDYEFFEMGVGGMDYKRRWSNVISPYNHFIIYPNTLISKSLGVIEHTRVKFKEFLKSKKVNDFIYALIAKFNRMTIMSKRDLRYRLKKCDSGSNIKANYSSEKEIHLEDYHFLKRPVYDFLYLTQEHLSSITILELEPERKYLLISEKNSYELYFEYT